MSEEKTAPAPQVWHSLRYHDAPAAIDLLTTVFGFRLVARYDSDADPALVEHAQLQWPEGGSGIMLGSHRESPDWPAATGHAAAYVSTDHVEEIYGRVRQASGLTVTQDLRSDDYGPGVVSQSFAVADPEGNLWSFGTYRGEPMG